MSDKETIGDNVVRVDFGRPRSPAKGTKAGPDVAVPGDPHADEKLQAFHELIENGVTMLLLDARRPGVRVPAQHSDDAQLRLNFSHLFGIADFTYDRWGVRASLSFQGARSPCEVPWTAVYGMRAHNSDEGYVWPDGFPDEMKPLADEIQQAADDEVRKEGANQADGEVIPLRPERSDE